MEKMSSLTVRPIWFGPFDMRLPGKKPSYFMRIKIRFLNWLLDPFISVQIEY